MASAGNEILLLRKAITATLVTALDPVDVREFPRRDVETRDLDAALKTTNVAVRVAFMGIARDSKLNTNEVDAPLVWGVFVAAKDIASAPARDIVALGLLPAVMRTVAQADWTAGAEEADQIETGKAERLGARELYAGEVDTKSACLWVVEWQQTTMLKPPLPDDLRELMTLITRYDIAPADDTIDAEDVIDMRHL